MPGFLIKIHICFTLYYLHCGENLKTMRRASRLFADSPVLYQKGTTLHRLCKNIDIKDVNTVLPYVEDCIRRHWKRHDFRDLLASHGMKRNDYYMLKDMEEAYSIGGIPQESQADFMKRLGEKRTEYHKAVKSIAIDACERIRSRKPGLKPVTIRKRRDGASGKERLIGCESAMQQVLDAIAVGAAMPIFTRRMVPQQASSIQGRGQVYGVRTIRRWIRKDNAAMRYAKRHRLRYTPKCKYFVKLDIEKCYGSARKDIFMRLFKHDCGNDDLIWLWDYLLSTHAVDGNKGFMIGALPSQWGAQYMLSFAYRYVKNLHFTRRGKAIKAVSHMIMFMDDMALFSSSRKALKSAVKSLAEYTHKTLGFVIKPTWHIKRLSECGLDMMGFVVHQSGKATIRGRNFIKARRMALRRLAGRRLCRKNAMRIMAYKGFFDNSDSREAAKGYHLKEIFNQAKQLIGAMVRKHNEQRRGQLAYVYTGCTV